MFNNRRNLITLVAVIGLLVFLSRFSFFSNIIGIIKKPLQPVQSRLYSAATATNNFVGNIFLAAQLEKEIRKLTGRVVTLSKESVIKKGLETENANLKKLLEFKETANPKKITLARVIAKSPTEPGVLIINKGSLDKLRAGQAVITESGVMLGKIIKSDLFSSELMLMTDSRSEISASLSKANQQAGIVTGEKGLSLKFQLIPVDLKIQKGDIVVTSGLEQEIPYGLLVATIEEIKKLPQELFQEAILKTIIPINDAVLVGVVEK